jgi:hypothetical protein
MTVSSQSNCSIYINGNLVYSAPFNYTIGTNSRRIIIGAYDVNGTNAGEFFQGNISLVQIYNRQISTTEVQQNYNAQKSRYGL